MDPSSEILKVAKKLISDKTESAGLFIRLPEHIAKYFPAKKEDSSDPHVTVLYIGSVPKDYANSYKKIVEVACETTPLGEMEFKDLAYFKNDEGKWIAHNPIKCKNLAKLRNKIWEGCLKLGLPIHDNYPKYRPHATLAYLDKKEYTDEIFTGVWQPQEIEIWGFGRPKKIKLNILK